MAALLSDLQTCFTSDTVFGKFSFHKPEISEEVPSRLSSFDVWVFGYPLYVAGIPSQLLSCLRQMEKVGVSSKSIIVLLSACCPQQQMKREICWGMALSNWYRFHLRKTGTATYTNAHAANLLHEHKGSNFVIDATNGFEDEKADVEWGFSVLLPYMAKADCKICVFIMSESFNIDGEIDLWSKEFMRYFEVKKVLSYEDTVGVMCFPVVCKRRTGF